MAKLISLQEVKSLASDLKKNHKKIVLAGGCFDLFHIGHIKFLEEAKKMGDVLIILLENDEKVKKLKGKNRPIFNEAERADVLSAIYAVDYIIRLSFLETDEDYNQVIEALKPDIIALTENDPLIVKKTKQAQKIRAKIHIVPYLRTFSSSRLAKIIGID